MINLIFVAIIAFILGMLFISIKNHIKNNEVSGVTEYEQFNVVKFLKGMFTCLNPVLWAKDIASIFSIRKIIIYIVIIASIFGYGYIKGLQNKPIKVDIGYNKEAYIRLDKNFLHITKDGTVQLEDKTGKIIKTITAKDMPEISKLLAPISLQLKPIGILGYGVGTNGTSGIEFGAGVSFFRFYKASLDAFLTNMGAYLGVSYSLEGIGLKNASVGFGAGRGWKSNDNRGIVYISVKF